LHLRTAESTASSLTRRCAEVPRLIPLAHPVHKGAPMNTPWWKEPTRGQWLAFGGAWIGWVLDAFDFTIFMLVMPDIQKELGVESLATTGSIALTLLARLAGGLLAGAAADRFGRKLPLLISVVWFALCDGAVAFAPSFTMILVLRTLFGFGMGAEWTSGTTLAMESWPKRSRGIASGVLQGSWAIGYLAAAVVSRFVLPLWGWRALFILAALPALLALPMRWWIPESHAKSSEASAPFRALLERPVLVRLIWASLAMALGLGVYYALTGLYPTLLKTERGMSAAEVADRVALFNVGMLVGSVIWGTVAARRGAKIAIALPALSSLLILPLYAGEGASGLGAFLGGALGVGFAGVTPLLLTNLASAAVRARFVGIAYHAGALFAALVPMAIAALASHGRTIGEAMILAAGVLQCALIVVVLAPIAPSAALADDEAQPRDTLEPWAASSRG
jgi:SHS family lactate transporter-like MFS transporter